MLDSGDPLPLQLLVGLEEEFTDQAQRVARRISLRGTEAPVSTDTLLQIARNIVNIPEMSGIAKVMIPREFSFQGLTLHSDLASIDGTIAVAWPNGHLKTQISATLPDGSATLQQLAFTHPLIGSLRGNSLISKGAIALNWNHLQLAPTTLSALALSQGLPPTSSQTLSEFLLIAPRGKITLNRQGAGTTGAITVHDDEQKRQRHR